jgi:hypothetical protein
MEDVLEVYTQQYDETHPLVCMDESSKQQTKEVREPIAAQPGLPQRYDTEYERNGVSQLFMFFEPLTGKRFVNVTERRTAIDWAHQIKWLVDECYPKAHRITWVMDNLNTHNGASLYKAFEPAQAQRILAKLDIHYTPRHGSWLNMAEIEFSVLARQCLNRRIPDRETLKREIEAWQKQRNVSPTPVSWRFTTKDARIKLKQLYPIIEN